MRRTPTSSSPAGPTEEERPLRAPPAGPTVRPDRFGQTAHPFPSPGASAPPRDSFSLQRRAGTRSRSPRAFGHGVVGRRRPATGGRQRRDPMPVRVRTSPRSDEESHPRNDESRGSGVSSGSAEVVPERNAVAGVGPGVLLRNTGRRNCFLPLTRVMSDLLRAPRPSGSPNVGEGNAPDVGRRRALLRETGGHARAVSESDYRGVRRRAATTRPSAEDARSPTLTESPPTLRRTTTAASVSGSIQAAAR